MYVQKVGSADAIPLSKDGGTEPMWSKDGREIYFRSGDRMMSAGVATPRAAGRRCRRAVEAAFDRSTDMGHAFYDVSPDGTRFLSSRTLRLSRSRS